MSRFCPACQGRRSVFVGEKLEYELVRCIDCGTLFTKEEPSEGEEQDYEDYGPCDSQVPDFIDKRCDELVHPFDAYRQLNRFLEIGFGAGTIIRAAARAGWRATGVEMSRAAVRSLSERHPDLELFSGTVESQGF